MQKLMSSREFASRLKVSRIAVDAYIKQGKIKALRIGNYYAIPSSELKKWKVRPGNKTRKLVKVR